MIIQGDHKHNPATPDTHKMTRGYNMKPSGIPTFKKCGKEENLYNKLDRTEIQQRMVPWRPREKLFIIMRLNNTVKFFRVVKKYKNREKKESFRFDHW